MTHDKGNVCFLDVNFRILEVPTKNFRVNKPGSTVLIFLYSALLDKYMIYKHKVLSLKVRSA